MRFISLLGFACSAWAQGATVDIVQCRPELMTPNDWVRAGVDEFFAVNLFSSDTPLQFPNSFFRDFDNVGGFNFNCAQFGLDPACVVPTLPDGSACGAFVDLKAAFVLESYVRLHDYLVKLHAGIQTAADNLLSGNFIEQMVQALERQEGPIPRRVLFQLVDLSFFLLPIGGAGLGAAKAAVSTLRQLGKTLVDINQQFGGQTPEAPSVGDMRNMMISIRNGFQQVVRDQFIEIFLSDAPGPSSASDARSNVHFLALSAGRQLGTPRDQATITAILEQNLRTYFIATFTSQLRYVVLADNRIGTGQCDDAETLRVGNTCRRIRLSQGNPGIATSAAVGDFPQNIRALLGFGLNIREVVVNAIECNLAQTTVDANQFLASGDTKFPRCLFRWNICDISCIVD